MQPLALLPEALYTSCAVLLAGSGTLVFRKGPAEPANRTFAAACTVLLAWLASLYGLLHADASPCVRTLLGRANFAAIALAVLLGHLAIAGLAGHRGRCGRLLWVESLALCAVTLLTPWVDRAELVRSGMHVTLAGPLMPWFALHIFAYPVFAVFLALRVRRSAPPRLVRQLSVIGLSLAVTAAANFVTGVILPYGFGVYRFEEAGALTLVVLAVGIAYAILFERLFDVRLAISRALLVASMVALVEQAYSESVSLVAERVPASSPLARHTLSVASVLFISMTFHPMKEWLKRALDGLLRRRRRAARQGSLR